MALKTNTFGAKSQSICYNFPKSLMGEYMYSIWTQIVKKKIDFFYSHVYLVQL